MVEKVEYIKRIFKMNIDNPYVVTDIAEELVKIEHFDDFRKWLKTNINYLDVQYMNPFQKFTFLIRMYLTQQLELKMQKELRIVKHFHKSFQTK